MVGNRVEIIEIEQFWKNYMASERAKDLEAILNTATDEIVIQRPAQPEVTGKDAFKEIYEGFFKAEVTNIANPAKIQIAKSKDLAYVVLHGKITGDLEFEYKGLYALNKVDGEWKIAAYCWNTNTP